MILYHNVIYIYMGDSILTYFIIFLPSVTKSILKFMKLGISLFWEKRRVASTNGVDSCLPGSHRFTGVRGRFYLFNIDIENGHRNSGFTH